MVGSGSAGVVGTTKIVVEVVEVVTLVEEDEEVLLELLLTVVGARLLVELELVELVDVLMPAVNKGCGVLTTLREATGVATTGGGVLRGGGDGLLTAVASVCAAVAPLNGKRTTTVGGVVSI